MKWQWIAHTHSPNLILFFNGLGMDQHVVSHLQTDADYDVLMVYDYRDLTFQLQEDVSVYRHIDVLAWSMGVWAYTRARNQLKGHIRHAVALNGTPCPIHESYGIPEAVYGATVRQFNEVGRKKFFKRMCGSLETLQWFELCQPQRLLEEQREELLAIQRFAMQQSQNSILPLFTCALISRHDKIMPTQHQIRYWQGTVHYRVIDSPHCAFRQWESWKEIFDDVTTD